MTSSYPTKGGGYNISEDLALEKENQSVKKESLTVRLIEAETIVAEKRKEIAISCFRWMRTTIWISYGLLLIFFAGIITGFCIVLLDIKNLGQMISVFMDQQKHLLIFILSLLSAYSLLAPYLLLKGILTNKSKPESPFIETIKDGVSLLSDNNSA